MFATDGADHALMDVRLIEFEAAEESGAPAQEASTAHG
jgi:hypothetical protein